MYIRASSFTLNFPLARENFITAPLSFLFLSATGFKNFPSVSRTSIGCCSSSTACVYFFLTQNTLIPSEMTTRKIKMKRSIFILVITVHTTFFTILRLFYVLFSRFCWFSLALAAYVFCLHTEKIKSLNGNRCQFPYYARMSLVNCFS